MRAHIEVEDNESLNANIANLTGSSVFVLTDVTPRFRSRAVVRLDDFELRGEVALVAREPCGFLVVFEVPVEQRVTFGALIEQVEALPETAWIEHTQPNPEPPEVVKLNALAADLLANAAPVVLIEPEAPAASPWVPPPARALPMLQDPPPPPPRSTSTAQAGPRAPLPRPGSGMGAGAPARAAMPRPMSSGSLGSASRLPAPTVVPSRPTPPAPPPASVTPPPAALPELSIDDKLLFRSGPDYAAHYRTHIAFGGVIARAAPRVIGSMHSLTVVVPGSGPPLSLRARVGFVGEGTVGLMIDSFPIEKPQLESLLSRLAAS